MLYNMLYDILSYYHILSAIYFMVILLFLSLFIMRIRNGNYQAITVDDFPDITEIFQLPGNQRYTLLKLLIAFPMFFLALHFIQIIFFSSPNFVSPPSAFGQQFGDTLKPEEVLWWGIKMPADMKVENIEKKVWIPLNVDDSLALEKHWRQFIGFDVCQNISPLFAKPILLLNGYYQLKEPGPNYYTLKPVYWEKEADQWIVIRSSCTFEVLSSPPPSYFTYIRVDLNSKSSYYQPIPCKFEKSESFLKNYYLINQRNQDKYPEQLIFGVHGIGHHQGQENIVQNVNDVRDMFIVYLRKYHPQLQVPAILPVAWRHKLPLNDKIINSIPLSTHESIKYHEMVLNDPLYYFKKYNKEIRNSTIHELNHQYQKFMKNNPDFSGNVSILAHSLGSVIMYDILNEEAEKLAFKVEKVFLIGSPLSRFLASDGISGDEIRKNAWIKNHSLFNLVHKNDPVATRMDALFHQSYQYMDLTELYFHRKFRETFGQKIEANTQEINEIAAFHNRLSSERIYAEMHDSFLIHEHLTNDYLNDATKRHLFYKYNILKTQRVSLIPENQRLPYIMDYDMYRPEFQSYFRHLVVQAASWGKESLNAHTLYWKRPEIVAFMINIFYNYIPNSMNIESFYAEDEVEIFPETAVFSKFYGVYNFLVAFVLLSLIFWGCFTVGFSYWYFYCRRPSFFQYHFNYIIFVLNNFNSTYNFLYCIFSVFLILFTSLEFLGVLLFVYVMTVVPIFLPYYLFHLTQLFEIHWAFQFCVYFIIFLLPTVKFIFSDSIFTVRSTSEWVFYVVMNTIFLRFLYTFGLYFIYYYLRSFDLRCRNPSAPGICTEYRYFNSIYFNDSFFVRHFKNSYS